jgi:NAD(P)-dependent dehydrogenase (short-subunit alcohol dehydrogenase family)
VVLITSIELRGKSAIVTGAGAGIGEAVATLFVSRGARLLAVDINETAANRTDASG